MFYLQRSVNIQQVIKCLTLCLTICIYITQRRTRWVSVLLSIKLGLSTNGWIWKWCLVYA